MLTKKEERKKMLEKPHSSQFQNVSHDLIIVHFPLGRWL